MSTAGDNTYALAFLGVTSYQDRLDESHRLSPPLQARPSPSFWRFPHAFRRLGKLRHLSGRRRLIRLAHPPAPYFTISYTGDRHPCGIVSTVTADGGQKRGTLCRRTAVDGDILKEQQGLSGHDWIELVGLVPESGSGGQGRVRGLSG